jgi:hypothetical protein
MQSLQRRVRDIKHSRRAAPGAEKRIITAKYAKDAKKAFFASFASFAVKTRARIVDP